MNMLEMMVASPEFIYVHGALIYIKSDTYTVVKKDLLVGFQIIAGLPSTLRVFLKGLPEIDIKYHNESDALMIRKAIILLTSLLELKSELPLP
jgi:hypothetical protein